MFLLSVSCYYVIGPCDKKETITPPEIKHLQAPDRSAPERLRRKAVTTVDKMRRET